MLNCLSYRHRFVVKDFRLVRRNIFTLGSSTFIKGSQFFFITLYCPLFLSRGRIILMWCNRTTKKNIIYKSIQLKIISVTYELCIGFGRVNGVYRFSVVSTSRIIIVSIFNWVRFDITSKLVSKFTFKNSELILGTHVVKVITTVYYLSLWRGV